MAGGGTTSSTKVVQITNIAPQATKDQMQSLFGNIGKIDEIRLYPTVRDVSCPVQSRICYVKYFDNSCVPVAQHLTNTVFIDRALIVIPVQAIPDEYRALEMSKNGTIVPGLHKPDAKLPPEVVNRLEGSSPQQVTIVELLTETTHEQIQIPKVVKTYDPKLEENGLPEYPPLPAHFDARKIEEIRRTIYVCDVKSDWRLDDLMEHFSKIGEVKYARWAEKDNKHYAMIEFCEQRSIIDALRLHGTEFKGALLNVYHATDAIAKPEAKSNEAAQREIEEAMTIVKEAQNMISAAIDPVIGMLAKDKRRRSRSRSRSRERRRSRSRSRRRSKSRRRSRSRTRSKRSRSKSKRRSRSRSRRSPSRAKRSRSRSKRSRSKRHSRSRSRSKHSRSRDRRKRSRSRRRSASRASRPRRSRSRGKRSRSRDRKRSHRKEEKTRRSRSRSKRRSPTRSQSSRSKDTKSSSSKRRSRSTESKRMKKIPEEPIVRDYDAEEKIGQITAEEKKKSKSKSPSVEKSDNMDISNSP